MITKQADRLHTDISNGQESQDLQQLTQLIVRTGF